MLLSVFASVLSTLWLGRLLGPVGLAVTAAFVAVELCVAAVFQALASGTMSLLARDVGAGSDRASRIVTTAVTLTTIVGAILCLFGVAISEPLARLLTDDPVVRPLLRSYAIGFAVATPLLGLATLGIAIFAAAGWAQVAFWRGAFELVLLVVFIPVAVEHVGVIGAPLAVLLASLIVVAGMAVTLSRQWTALRFGPRPSRVFVVDLPLWREIVAIGGPPQIGRLSSFVAFGIMIGLVARDSTVLAGALGIAYRLLTIATTFGFGFSRAQAIVAGQCIGARRATRAIRSLWSSLVLGTLVGVVLVFLQPFAGPLVRLFSDDPVVVDATMHAASTWRWLVIAVTAWYIFVAAYSATGAVNLASAMTVASDAIALVVFWGVGEPWSTAAIWGVVVQHVARVLLLACLVRHGFLAPVARRAA